MTRAEELMKAFDAEVRGQHRSEVTLPLIKAIIKEGLGDDPSPDQIDLVPYLIGPDAEELDRILPGLLEEAGRKP